MGFARFYDRLLHDLINPTYLDSEGDFQVYWALKTGNIRGAEYQCYSTNIQDPLIENHTERDEAKESIPCLGVEPKIPHIYLAMLLHYMRVLAITPTGIYYCNHSLAND